MNDSIAWRARRCFTVLTHSVEAWDVRAIRTLGKGENVSKTQCDLIESGSLSDAGRREFFHRILKFGIMGGIASLIPEAITASAFGVPDQNEWRQCRYCSSLFYNGYRNKGRCPFSREGHSSDGGTDYALTYDAPGPGQRDWRFCNKCQALFWNGYTNKGVCKGGGGHVAAGYNFTLRYDARAPGRYRNWRFCNKCETLFFDGQKEKGVCAGGGGHVSAGYNFVLAAKGYAY